MVSNKHFLSFFTHSPTGIKTVGASKTIQQPGGDVWCGTLLASEKRPLYPSSGLTLDIKKSNGMFFRVTERLFRKRVARSCTGASAVKKRCSGKLPAHGMTHASPFEEHSIISTLIDCAGRHQSRRNCPLFRFQYCRGKKEPIELN